MATQTEKTPALVARPVVEALPDVPARVGQLLLPAASALPPARRLVVLVPAGLKDDTALAQHIWSLAQPRGLPVLFVGHVQRVEDESALRRRLIFLAAVTRDNHAVSAQYRLAVQADWLALLRSLCQPGDLVICHAEQRALRQPLSQVLANRLGTPLYMLSGNCEPETGDLARLGRQMLFWAGALAVVAGFFWLQVNLQQQSQGWIQSLVLILSVLTEFGVLAAWNSWLK
jgi:hypothetical protein